MALQEHSILNIRNSIFNANRESPANPADVFCVTQQWEDIVFEKTSNSRLSVRKIIGRRNEDRAIIIPEILLPSETETADICEVQKDVLALIDAVTHVAPLQDSNVPVPFVTIKDVLGRMGKPTGTKKTDVLRNSLGLPVRYCTYGRQRQIILLEDSLHRMGIYEKIHPLDRLDLPRPTLENKKKQLVVSEYEKGEKEHDIATEYNLEIEEMTAILIEHYCAQINKHNTNFIYNADFNESVVKQAIVSPLSDPIKPYGKIPDRVDSYTAHLFFVPLLDRENECELFREYNFLKYQARRIQDSMSNLSSHKDFREAAKTITALMNRAISIKKRITESNLRLVRSIAKQHITDQNPLPDLESDAIIPLMQALEKFDYSRGNKFSTYATWAIMRGFQRTIPNECKQRSRFRTNTHDGSDSDQNEHNTSPYCRTQESDEASETVPLQKQARRENEIVQRRKVLDQREDTIITYRFGLGEKEPITLKEIGGKLGVSKERIRQLEDRSLRKMRSAEVKKDGEPRDIQDVPLSNLDFTATELKFVRSQDLTNKYDGKEVLLSLRGTFDTLWYEYRENNKFHDNKQKDLFLKVVTRIEEYAQTQGIYFRNS